MHAPGKTGCQHPMTVHVAFGKVMFLLFAASLTQFVVEGGGRTTKACQVHDWTP